MNASAPDDASFFACRPQPVPYNEYQVLHPTTDAINDILTLIARSTRLRIRNFPVESGCRLHDLGDGRLVKSGGRVTLDEAKAMLFIRAHTSIPVPRVHMAFVHDEVVHIVMDLIDGLPLGDAVMYTAISDAELLGIVAQWREIACVIRELGKRFTHTKFGSWPDGPYRNTYFSDGYPATPFRCIDDFHAYWDQLLQGSTRFAGGKTHLDLQALRRKSQDQDETPVLAHGDLSSRNILVKDGKIVAVVDWETIGWYPTFWEAVSMKGLVDKRLGKAMRDVFQKWPEAATVYSLVLACLDSPY